MAEQRPYRLSGTASDASLRQTKIVAMLTLGVAVVVVNWVTTQHAARLFGYSRTLGAPWCYFPLIGLLYHPWDWMVWWWRWHSEPTLAPLWELCTHEAVYPMIALSVMAMGAIAVARDKGFRNPSDLHGSARWANTRDLRAAGLVDKRHFLPRRLRRIAERAKLLKPVTQRAGVYLGVWRRSHIRECGRTHILVFAPTQSGKGRGIVIPTLLTWPHSVIVHDLKGENWALTAGARKRLGQLCLKFEPASPESGLARFNPLAEVRLRTPYEVRDVQNIVQPLLDPDGRGLPDHWSRAGSEAFEAFILHRLYEGGEPTLGGVGNLLFDPERKADQTVEHLMRAEHDPTGALGWKDAHGNPTRTHPLVAGGMRSLLDMAEKERASVISEVKGFLRLYRDPVIAANTAVSDFCIDDLVNHRRPLSLYIAVTVADQDRMRPLMRLVLAQILNRLTERLEYRDGRAVAGSRHRLLLMIDEFPTLGRLEMFAESLSLIAGYGIKACLITQDITQIHRAYGRDETITSNCDTRVAFRPNGIETGRLLSQMTGETTVRHVHRTISNSGASVSEPEVARPLLTPDEAMRLNDSEALIFASGRPAIRAAKLRYYTEPFFKQRAAIQAPLKSDRIANSTAAEKTANAVTASSVSSPITQKTKSLAEDRSAAEINSLGKAAEPQPVPQLAFLKFAVDHAGDAAAITNRGRKKERLL
ncbi:MAG TPA: type IV secretory system conjugative DNA transfer family protein [Candidatus Acidoferrales bacterium]|nr:type IV secretory system conjugative DNA transfer family protein [Candidatus Acidoferrales bacterium]